MRTESTLIVTLYADEDCWLYQDQGENRIFAKKVTFRDGTTPWPECTDAEKVEWEESHQPEPEPENQEDGEDIGA